MNKFNRLTLLVAAVCLALLASRLIAKPETAKVNARLDGLRAERLATAKELVKGITAAYEADTVSIEAMFSASREVLKAELAISKVKADRVAAYRNHLDRAKRVERKTTALYEQGAKGGEHEKYQRAKLERLKVEIALEEEQQKPDDK